MCASNSAIEALPLELREEIFSHLLPRLDQTQIVSVPVSSKAERTDVYNLRLTSRRTNTGAAQAFLNIIGDIPTACSKQSIQNLANLVGLVDVRNHIVHLTFHACRLFTTETLKTSQLSQTFVDRCQWLRETYRGEILAILRKTTRLRHLTCLPEVRRGPNVLSFSNETMYALQKILSADGVYDPMQFIQEALKTTALNETLETLTILPAFSEPYVGPFKSMKKAQPLYLPKLKHLTLGPSYHDISRFTVYCPNITSWHTVLDSRAETFDLIPSRTQRDPFQTSSSLHSYTISAQGQHIKTKTLVRAIAAVTDRIPFIPIFVIRDMVLLFDINYDVHALPGEGRFKELVFENMQYCFTDEITLSGPSEPKELDRKWRVLPTLCERAERVRLKTELVDRVLERGEWQGTA